MKRITVAHSNKRQPLVEMWERLNEQHGKEADLGITGRPGSWKLRGMSPPLPDRPCLTLYQPL